MGRARARARQGKQAKVRPPKNPPKGGGPARGAHEGIRINRIFLGLFLGALWGLAVWVFTIVLGGDAVIGLLLFFVVACSLVGGATLGIMEGANARKRGEPLFGSRR